MSRFNGWGLMVLLCASTAMGQDAPAVMEDTPASDAPAQAFSLNDWLLGEENVMNNAGVEFFGWIQQGFTWNPDSPDNRFNGPNGFNFRSNEYQLNQLYAVVERQVDREAASFDIGARIDLMVGSDTLFIERQGIELHSNGTDNWNNEDVRFNHFGAPQFYADLMLPVGNGLLVRAGRFYTLHLANESVMAPNNFFYSHTYSYIYGLGYLDHTGILFSYPVNEQWTVEAGYTTSPVAFSPGHHFDGHGGVAAVRWKSEGGRTAVDLVASHDTIGYADFFFFGGEVEAQITAVSGVVRHDFTDRLSGVLTGVYGRLNDLEPDLFDEETDGWWVGVSAALTYEICPTLSVGGRLEWFHDHDDLAIYTLVFGTPLGASDFLSATAAVNWKPHPNINIRPEIRVDTMHADFFVVDHPYDDFTEHTQVTASVDVIITF